MGHLGGFHIASFPVRLNRMTMQTEQEVGFDARAIANLFLEQAEPLGIHLTNLSLQKLVYFAHGLMWSRYRRPLVDGYFEAWEFGPVHPVLYGAFKGNGRAPIAAPATRTDLRTGGVSMVPPPSDALAIRVVREVLGALGNQPATQLVNLSHAKGGPWDAVVNERGTRPSIGLRIPDSIIRERFNRHMMAVGPHDPAGDVLVESPPA